jgi:hypothetical protein
MYLSIWKKLIKNIVFVITFFFGWGGNDCTENTMFWNTERAGLILLTCRFMSSKGKGLLNYKRYFRLEQIQRTGRNVTDIPLLLFLFVCYIGCTAVNRSVASQERFRYTSLGSVRRLFVYYYLVSRFWLFIILERKTVSETGPVIWSVSTRLVFASEGRTGNVHASVYTLQGYSCKKLVGSSVFVSPFYTLEHIAPSHWH